ncbi:hypothetical protein U9M48_024276 [Paspalum notatum var. saurae]|uniref:Integrase catalytic domain-containing protein n=1 Tax=Paspalum notatum var. saurae TaxID=547442 RepID=A0AAQ3TLC1_PASNO
MSKKRGKRPKCFKCGEVSHFITEWPNKNDYYKKGKSYSRDSDKYHSGKPSFDKHRSGKHSFGKCLFGKKNFWKAFKSYQKDNRKRDKAFFTEIGMQLMDRDATIKKLEKTTPVFPSLDCDTCAAQIVVLEDLRLQVLSLQDDNSRRKQVERQERAWGNQDQFYQGGRQDPLHHGEMRDRVAGGERGGSFQDRVPGDVSALDRGMEDVWIMDSGCSRHMTGHRKWFSSLNPVSTKEYITFGDNGQGKLWGVGSVSLYAKLSPRQVAFVQNLGFNLVSVSQLLVEGFEFHFKKDACRVLDAEETLVRSLLPFGQVFRVDLISISGPVRCLVASPSADIWKWHRRLGHLSFDLLVRLSSMGLIRGLPKLKAEKDLVCHPCRHGKMVAASHTPVSQVMTSYPGELLHMDTVGPARVASVSGKWYVLIVVDDFSRFSWVFFMEFKDEAFGFVWYLVLRLRNKSHKAMRAIRSDNGGEFRNSRFKNFCRDLGLEHQFSSPYTPPQNSVVECKNHTLVEMSQTMLDEHRTPRRFWAEAVNTACYIANRIFLRAFLGKTSRRVIWTSLASSSRAFRVWILDAKQVVETCEVSFDETMPYTTPAFELSGNDEEGTPIFEDEEGADDVCDAGATAPATAPAPSATSSDDEVGPLTTASSSLPRQQAQAEAGPAEDVGEQMDVKSAFLNGFIEEEVYVRQPPGFESARFSDWVYKLRKALYGLKQAPRAWYARFLLKSGFVMGSVDKTLFLLIRGGDTLILQIYVDDIIFGGSSHALVSSFAEQMSREFEMSLMGELQFFLRLQIKQGPEGTFIHQAKYTRDILKKFEMGDSKPMTTPMSTNTVLDTDEDGEAVDQKEFRGMIGSLLYLTATRPDIQFAVCLCARFSLSLRGFSDADHAGCQIDRKSTSGICQFLRTSLVSWSSRKQACVALSTTEAEYVAAASCCPQLLWIKATLSDFGLRLMVLTMHSSSGRPRWTEAKALQWTGGKSRCRSTMEARYTEGQFGNGGVSPPMDREATLMDWRSRVPPWCSRPSAWREGVQGRLWRLRLKTATQVQMTWWVGLRLAKIEDWAKTRPRMPVE